MKNIILFALLLSGIICGAQSPILPLFYPQDNDITGAYYKDLNNDFDKFIGTWEYSNSGTSLRIIIQKRQQYFNSFGIYEDILIGEYRYVENGVEKVNSLNEVDYDPDGAIVHSIFGNSIIKKTSPPVCNDCAENERRVNLSFLDPTRSDIEGLRGRIVLRRVDVGNVQKLKMDLRQVGNIIYIDGNPPQYDTFSVPVGEYILTKVN